jgi:SAM-dependent methyltransferase
MPVTTSQITIFATTQPGIAPWSNVPTSPIPASRITRLDAPVIAFHSLPAGRASSSTEAEERNTKIAARWRTLYDSYDIGHLLTPAQDFLKVTTDLSPTSWNEKYKAGDTPWDLSGPTPEFTRLLDEKKLPPKGKVLVPGGGRGHDAIQFAKRGYDVDLVDWAPDAVQAALEAASREKAVVYAYTRNFFDLSAVGYHQETYDILLEYTFFCAIPVEDRPRYVKAAAALLRKGGVLVGLFFPTSSDKPGPPFLVSQTEIEKLFSPYFDVKIEKPAASVKPREGREFLGIFKRK